MDFMEALFIDTSRRVILLIEVIVLAMVAIATLVATWRTLRLGTVPATERMSRARSIWLDYARWLVAGLTLQLGADILESSIAPTWQAIAQLGTIAVIRTFLNYFLERDIREVSERVQGHAGTD